MQENTTQSFQENEYTRMSGDTKSSRYSFVVLDLETTGLDTKTETIIEIAAIRFVLEQDTLGKWHAVDKEERTMLIDPERELTEEISLITHITGDMLIGKPTWNDVRERVRAFLDGSIIVGHNVLFDVAMLKTHGIDLSDNIILDTFELSELFSHESESLNLGFLGGKYGFTTQKGEHRALGDTEICLDLFLHYLREIEKLSERDLSILNLIKQKEEKQNIGFLLEFLGKTSAQVYTLQGLDFDIKEATTSSEDKKNDSKNTIKPNIISLSTEKIDILSEELAKKYRKIHILTVNNKTTTYAKSMLDKGGYKSLIGIRRDKWCSLRYIHECLEQRIWKRKFGILMGRVLLWLDRTESGIFDELKLYGEEYSYRENFLMNETEENTFSIKYEQQEKDSPIMFYSFYDYIKIPPREKPDCLILKDIGLLDENIRKALSFSINISELIRDIGDIVDSKENKDKIIHALTLIEHIYENIPDRPHGKAIFPPGNFGETYFFDQVTLWKEGGVWLLLATRLLDSLVSQIETPQNIVSSLENKWKKCINAINFLISYHVHTSACTSIVIEIGRDGTLFRYIPHILDQEYAQLLEQGAREHIELSGYGIHGDKVSSFLEREYKIDTSRIILPEKKKQEIEIVESLREMKLGGYVILTTSMKHIRELGKECEKMGFKVLMQGISGGKSKIQSLFEKNIESTVLIGLIDTWKDEYDIWRLAHGCIIAKLPFDPPSDPYFLARTVGMSNNFSLYSEPLVIIRINTLIGRMRSGGYTGSIYTLDTRLSTTIWGVSIRDELL